MMVVGLEWKLVFAAGAGFGFGLAFDFFAGEGWASVCFSL
jgi:hypothetical protein